VYDLVGFTLVLVDPSPNCHAEDVYAPVERLVKLTVSGAVPVNGLPLKFATGAAGLTVIVREADDFPAALETVNTAVYVPGFVYVFATVALEPEDPSPKLHARVVTDPLDVSVKVTVNGAGPLVGLAEKLAAGAAAVAATVALTSLE